MGCGLSANPGAETGERLTPFFDFPPEIGKVIYTANAIESVNFSLRKLTKHCGAFPNDDALIKLLYLALRNISKFHLADVNGNRL